MRIDELRRTLQDISMEEYVDYECNYTNKVLIREKRFVKREGRRRRGERQVGRRAG